MRRWMAVQIKPLFKAQSNAIYADGYLLIARNEQLLAQAFNPPAAL